MNASNQSSRPQSQSEARRRAGAPPVMPSSDRSMFDAAQHHPRHLDEHGGRHRRLRRRG